jgi:hypothetical protein
LSLGLNVWVELSLGLNVGELNIKAPAECGERGELGEVTESWAWGGGYLQ